MAALAAFPRLAALSLASSHMLRSESLAALAPAGRRLTSLDLSDAAGLDGDVAAKLIGRHLTMRQQLSMRGCSSLTAEGAQTVSVAHIDPSVCL